MKIRCVILAIVIFGLPVVRSAVSAANAAEIKVFTARAIATVLDKIGPEFERQTGHKLNVISGFGPVFMRQINAGEPFDVFVSTPPTMEGLFKEAKLIADTRTNLVRSGTGVEVRAGAPKPDISTVEAFKRALLNSKSIGYLKSAGCRNLSIGSGLRMPSNRKSRSRIPMRFPNLSPRVNWSSAWSSSPRY